MCEENIIALSTHDSAKSGLANAGGFVPIGDLIATAPEQRHNVAFKMGPRGIKIPQNPHISEADKKERCRNCVIYNDHQRLKYNLIAPIVTLSAPVLIFLNFEVVKGVLLSSIGSIEGLVKAVTVSGHTEGIKQVTQELSGSLPVIVIATCAVGLILVSYVNRFIEFCIFKLKI